MANLSQDQINQIYQARPDVQTAVNGPSAMSPEKRVTNWYDKYTSSGGQPLFSATQAYSAPNITAASTAPAARPDDLMGIRTSIYNDLGIPKMQTDQQALYNQVMNYDNSTDTGGLGIMNENKTMGVLRGEDAQYQNQRSVGRGALARSLDAVNNSLSSAMSEAGDRYNIRANEVGDVKQLMLQYPDAGIGFGDSTETMAQKVKVSNEHKTVVDMFTQTFGYFPTGLSQEQMNTKLAKKYKSTKAYEDVKNALSLQKLQGTDALTKSENADKARKLAEDYVKSVATEVKGGHITREQAKTQIEQKYPGYGDTIYNEVPDNYVIKPDSSSTNPFS